MVPWLFQTQTLLLMLQSGIIFKLFFINSDYILSMSQQNPYQIRQSPQIEPLPQANYQSLQSQKPVSPTSHLSDGLEGQARTSYIAKVYILLSLQLAITFGICMLSQYCAAYRNFQMDYAWVVIFPILLLITVCIVAFCVPKARQFPIDMILLLVFVLSFSYVISMSCSAVVDSVDGPVVPIAVGATLAVTLALTLYAFLCKGNFIAMIGIVVVCAMTALVVGITAIFTQIPALIYVYCSLAIVIFGIYLVIITKMIIGGDYPGFPMDAPILSSLFLYIYIMRIFIYILAILGAKR